MEVIPKRALDSIVHVPYGCDMRTAYLLFKSRYSAWERVRVLLSLCILLLGLLWLVGAYYSAPTATGAPVEPESATGVPMRNYAQIYGGYGELR